jgi:hypothetical protein
MNQRAVGVEFFDPGAKHTVRSDDQDLTNGSLHVENRSDVYRSLSLSRTRLEQQAYTKTTGELLESKADTLNLVSIRFRLERVFHFGARFG